MVLGINARVETVVLSSSRLAGNSELYKNVPPSINATIPHLNHHALKTPCTPSVKDESPDWQHSILQRLSESIFISATKLKSTNV